MKDTILFLDNVTIGYTSKKQSKVIAKNIHLKISKGEFVALIGKNGSGKSTLLKTLNRLITPLEGTILIENTNIRKISAHEFSKHIAVVLTDQISPNNLNVFDVVALGRQPHTNWIGKLTNQDKTLIKNALLATDTFNICNSKISELSDGQKQRVMIARALCQDTPIILLDEPTSHLDIQHKIAIFNLLQHISHTTKKTIIIATHEINIALRRADQLIIMNNEVYFGNLQNSKTIHFLEKIFNNKNVVYNSNLKQFVM